ISAEIEEVILHSHLLAVEELRAEPGKKVLGTRLRWSEFDTSCRNAQFLGQANALRFSGGALGNLIDEHDAPRNLEARQPGRCETIRRRRRLDWPRDWLHSRP